MKIIRTFATSANLGPGFDCLGICFDLYNEYEFCKSDNYVLSNFPEKFLEPKNNLIIQSYEKVFRLKNKELQCIYIRQNIQQIPPSRGLGSSASCIVAGVMIANDVLNNILSVGEIFQIASDIEGHPDNVAPLIYGGLVCSFKENNYKFIKLTVSKNLKFSLFIPSFEILTKESRELLPEYIAIQDVVSNISHAILMVKGLEKGDCNLLRIAQKDFIHEPYRKLSITDYEVIKEIARNNDIVSLISGAGPSILLISNQDVKDIFKLKNWQIIDVSISHKGAYIYEKQ